MNLKRIVREEMDDVWQSLTQGEPNIWISYQVLVFDEEPTKEEVIKFIKDAFKSGLVKNEAIRTWELEGLEDEAETIYEYSQKGTHPYLRIDLNNGWLYYGEYYSSIDSKSSELKTIKFSEAKNYLIRESEDEWGWAKESKLSLPQNKKGLKEFIGWSFVWDISGKRIGDWGYNGRQWLIINIKGNLVYYRDQETNGNNDISIGGFLNNLQNGGWTMISPEGILFDPVYNRTYNKNINESTGLEWMNDIVPENTDDFRVGDIIKVNNVSNEKAFLSWLGDYRNSYEGGDYGDYIVGEVIEVTEDSFVLKESKTRDEIYFPKYQKMERLRQGTDGGSSFGEYNGLNMIYELLNIKY